MAKSKKSEQGGPSASGNATPKPKKKPAAKRETSRTPGAAGIPPINTSAAAQVAARMIGAKGAGIGSGHATGPAHESSTFKQMKENLAKPHLGGMDNVLNNTNIANAKKSAMPFGANKQVGRNQTFGADVNRAGVPRRTGGG